MPTPRIRSLIFVLIFGFACASYLQRQGIGIAAERMMPELGLTQVQVGWIMNAFLITYAVFQVPGGLFGQRFGARLTIAIIGILSVLASVLTAAAPLIATSALMFTTLVIARSLLGVAHGGLFPVEAGTIRHWYPVTRWSSMLGLLVTGLWTGAALASPLVASLMHAYGWQAAILLTSVPSLLLVALWWIVVRDLPERHPWVKSAELAELAANPAYDAAAPLTARRVIRVLGDPQILLVTLSYLVMNYVFYLVTFWSFLYLVQDRKLSVLESGWLGAVPFVVAGIAAAVGGRIADGLRRRFGDRNGPRILPLVTLPFAALFLYLTVSIENAYPAIAALCLGFACVELNEGNYWGVAMRLAPNRRHGGDRGPEHRRQPRRGHRHRPRRGAFVRGPLGPRIRDRRRHVCRRGAPLAYHQPGTRRADMTDLQATTPPERPFLDWPVAIDPSGWNGARVALLGIRHSEPYSHDSFPNDQSKAPDAIRRMSQSFCYNPAHWDFDLGTDLASHLPAHVDMGNVAFDGGDYSAYAAAITARARRLWQQGTQIIVLGGDHGVTIPVVDALDAVGGPVHILHIDAHLDWREEVGGVRRGYSSPLQWASKVKAVSGMTQIGLRAIGSARRRKCRRLAPSAHICSAPNRYTPRGWIRCWRRFPRDARSTSRSMPTGSTRRRCRP